jgi:hypothetical protein
MDYTNIFPTLFRYIVLAGLYAVVFANFGKDSIQFILFMVVFILNFFTLVFIGRDIMTTPELVKNIYDLYSQENPENRIANEYQNPFIKYFVAIIGLTLILFICSLSIILAVFDYGKKRKTEYTSYELTPANNTLIQTFETSYQNYLIYLAALVYLIIFAHTTGKMRTIMLNIVCVLLSILLISISIYNCVIAVQFFNNKKYKRQLYQ